MYEVEKKYNRDDARANLKSEPRADIPFLRVVHISVFWVGKNAPYV